MLVFVLTGCSTERDYETVMDTYTEPAPVAAQQIMLQLPPEASMEVFDSSEAGTYYQCDGYEIILQTLEAGDLDKTFKEVTGFSKADLTVMETAQGEMKRYDCVWSAAGEGKEQIGRAAVLDDGNYHYVLTVMADFSKAGALQEAWQGLFDTFTVINTGA